MMDPSIVKIRCRLQNNPITHRRYCNPVLPEFGAASPRENAWGSVQKNRQDQGGPRAETDPGGSLVVQRRAHGILGRRQHDPAAGCLEAIHAAGIVHNDIRPGNTLFDGDAPST
jgi:serine/threonine protein kinase